MRKSFMYRRNCLLYFSDIVDSGKAILSYVDGICYSDFCEDRKTYSAVIREFEIIGEAVSKIPKDYKEKYPEIQ